MRVVVTGGCGYIGTVLVPKLLEAGHEVRVVDTMWFGNFLQPHPRLIVDRADIREEFAMGGAQAVIHLAAVANDPQGDLDPKLTWEVNALATMRLADRCARENVNHFIYASSGSVYGVSDAPRVTEDLPCYPLSEYNKTKMVAERCVLSYADRMAVQILRPGTVCGVSPRMRLDVVVNRYTMQAIEKGAISVLGGKQQRPNIHIEDMTDLYLWMLMRPDVRGVYNAAFENLTLQKTAKMVADHIGCRTTFLPSNDPRSYRINSEKLLAAGFQPRYSVMDAVKAITLKARNGQLRDEERWHNILSMPKSA